MISTAVDQISFYRDVLRDPSTGLWRHVLISTDFSDPQLWATGTFFTKKRISTLTSVLMFFFYLRFQSGNAWAAAGIVRTLATIQNSDFSGKFKSQKSDLTNWADEIQTAFYKLVVSLGDSLMHPCSRLLPPSLLLVWEDSQSLMIKRKKF